MKLNLTRSLLALPVVAAAAVGLSMWSTTSFTPLEASSHREAPMIGNDPVADNTDLYAFRDPNDGTKVNIIANYIPFELPHGGPNYSTFGENVRYEIHVKNDGSTNQDDITYRFTFTRTSLPPTGDPTTFFNIRLGKENLKTTYTCEKSTNGGATFSTIVTNGVVPPNNIGPRSIEGGAGLGAPNYESLRTAAITSATGAAAAGETIFCGPADDPFFADLGAIFDLAGLRPASATDGLSRKNCHTIALQIPINTLKKAGAPAVPANILDPDYVIGVWASASRPMMQTFSTASGQGQSGTWVQVSRLGMPLTNEVINPIGTKDAWNAASPYAEAAVTEDYLSNPEVDLYMADNTPVSPQAPKTVAATYYGEAVPALAALRIQTKSLAGFPGLPANGFDFRNGAAGLSGLAGSSAVAGTALAPIASGGLGEYLLVPGKPRSVDVKPIFHTGVPNARPFQLATGKGGNPLAAGKPFINNFLLLTQGGPHGGDMLRLNMAVPATPRNSAQFSNQGLLAAAALGLTTAPYNNISLQNIPNMDGFPNGRRLEDAVDQIELKAASGLVLAAIGLWFDDYTTASPNPLTPELLGQLNFTSGVEANDTTFRAAFPYVQTPWRGTGDASGPKNGPLTFPDLTVNTVMPVEAGTYNNVTITSTGTARFNGPIVIRGTLTLQTGGTLDTRGVLATNCLPVTGSGSFVMQPGSTLVVCNDAGIATSGASGAIQLTGTRTYSSFGSTYVYTGGGAQVTGSGLPPQVTNLTVNNAAGVTLTNPLQIDQTLTLTNGNLNTSNAQLLTLRSSLTQGTALVVNTNGVVSGPAVMQRVIRQSGYNGPGYHHYSSPVSNTVVSDFATAGFTPILTASYNTAPMPYNTTPFPNLYGYQESRVTDPSNSNDAFNMGFFVPAAGDAVAILAGYDLNINTAQVVDLRGTLNNGPLTRSGLTRGNGAQSGWAFLGNPYPSPIDFLQTSGVSRTNLDDAVYVFNPTGQYTGFYRTYVNGIGNPKLSAMQGFFSRVSAPGTASITMNNALRITDFATQQQFFRNTADTRPLVQLQLSGSGSTLQDEAYVYFQQGATAAYDGRFDAFKLANTSGMSLSSVAGADALAVNGLPLLTGNTTVPLTVAVPAAGSYTLNVAALANFGATQVWLLDTQLGTRTNLSTQASYTFRTSTTAMPGRFSLFFGAAGALATKASSLADQVQLFPNPAHGSFTLLLPTELGSAPVTVKVINQLGQLVSSRTVTMTAAGASAQFDVSSYAPGVYSLQMTSGSTKVVKRVVVQ